MAVRARPEMVSVSVPVKLIVTGIDRMRSLPAPPEYVTGVPTRPVVGWTNVGAVMVVLKWAIGVTVGRLILMPFAVVMFPMPLSLLTVIVERVAVLPVTKVRPLLLDMLGGGLVTNFAVAFPFTPGRLELPPVPSLVRFIVIVSAVLSEMVKVAIPVVLVVMVVGVMVIVPDPPDADTTALPMYCMGLPEESTICAAYVRFEPVTPVAVAGLSTKWSGLGPE